MYIHVDPELSVSDIKCFKIGMFSTQASHIVNSFFSSLDVDRLLSVTGTNA